MNFEEKGKGPLFKIYSETDKKVNLRVYLDEEMYNDNEGYNNVQLEKGLQIQHLPNNAVSQEREIIYCAGRSGSEDDETLKELKVKKFKLDDKFLQANLELDFFKESLVLFDDIEMISDKAILYIKNKYVILIELGLLHVSKGINYTEDSNKGLEQWQLTLTVQPPTQPNC